MMNRRFILTFSLSLLLTGLLVMTAGCNVPRAEDSTATPTLGSPTAPLPDTGETQDSSPITIYTATPAGSGSDGPTIITATPSSGGSNNPPVVTSPPQPQADAVVNTTNLRLRTGPNTQFPIVRQMPNGTPLTIAGKNGNYTAGSQQLWLYVSTSDGAQGWAAGWLMTINKAMTAIPVIPTPIPPTPVPTDTAVPQDPLISFTTQATELWAGECTQIMWKVENIKAVFLDDVGVVGEDTKEVCPTETTTYTLRVIKRDDTTTYATVTINIRQEPQVEFRTDRYQIGPGECTHVRWDVEGASAVYFQGDGVIGHSEAYVCPGETMTYHLQVVGRDGSTPYDYYRTIYVDAAYAQ